jgi:hypothetical protein
MWWGKLTVFVGDLEQDKRDFLNSFQRSLQTGRGASISKILSFKAKEGSIEIVHLPMVDGQLQPDVVAAWVANSPLAMVHQYIPALRRYQAIAFDAGDRDVGIAATVRTLDQVLSGYDVVHTASIYDGDHVSAIEQRLETQVLPFFTRHLQTR